MCSRLNDGDNSFVSFVGVYSTREHVFSLVFKFMECLNLRGYVRSNRDVGRLDLVRFHCRIRRSLLSHGLDTSCCR